VCAPAVAALLAHVVPVSANDTNGEGASFANAELHSAARMSQLAMLGGPLKQGAYVDKRASLMV
jgi:hypothetical protein